MIITNLVQGEVRYAVYWNSKHYSYNEINLSIDNISEKIQLFVGKTKSLILLKLPHSLNEYLSILSLLKLKLVGLNTGDQYSNYQISEIVDQYQIEYIITSNKVKTWEHLTISTCELTSELIILKIIKKTETKTTIPNDCAWTLLTSGTTGKSKAVMISYDNLEARTKSEILCFDLSSNDKILNFLSFSHDLGLNQLLTTYKIGACLYIHNYIFLNDLFQNIIDNKITGFTAIPNIWRDFLKNKLNYTFSDLRFFTISGGSLSQNEIVLLNSIIGENVKIIRTYGQTETFRSLIQMSKNEKSTGISVMGTHQKIINETANGIGELVHYGDGSMMGYLFDNISTNEKITSDGGIKTGDYFQKMPDGSYQFSCRKDEMQKIKGIRFYPQLIEEKILENENILDTIVFLIPDESLIDTLIACLVIKNEISDQELIAFLKNKLTNSFIPKKFVRLHEFSKTHSGKNDRLKIQKVAQSFLLNK